MTKKGKEKTRQLKSSGREVANKIDGFFNGIKKACQNFDKFFGSK